MSEEYSLEINESEKIVISKILELSRRSEPSNLETEIKEELGLNEGISDENLEMAYGVVFTLIKLLIDKIEKENKK